MKTSLEHTLGAIREAIVFVEALSNPKSNVRTTVDAIFAELTHAERVLQAFRAHGESENFTRALEYIELAKRAATNLGDGDIWKAHEALQAAVGFVKAEIDQQSALPG